MKAKSMKLRMLVTLYALYKHSDADHRMNSIKLNEYLKPFGLNCTSRVLSDTVRVLREFGIDVRHKGIFDNQGVWIEDRLLSDESLQKLIYAVSTNPYISKEEKTDILSALTPVVTEFQEHLLQSIVDTNADFKFNDKLYETYTVVLDAIQKNKRVAYTVEYLKVDKETGEILQMTEWKTLFVPKWIYQTKDSIYMVGYNTTDNKISAVNLNEISSVKLAFKHSTDIIEKANSILVDILPEDIVPGEVKRIIYCGPVEFYCRGQYMSELYKKFSPPDRFEKDHRGRTKYFIQNAEITSETLFWLSQIKDYGIRIKGPENLIFAVKDYYAEVEKNLLNPKFLYKKKGII